MRNAIIIGVAVCLLSAVPAFADLETNWEIDLANVPGQGLSGILTVGDVNRIDYNGVFHTSVTSAGPFGPGSTFHTDGLFAATDVADNAHNSVSTASEVLNGPQGGPLTSFQITFVLHVDTVVTAAGFGPDNIPFVHEVGATQTLDMYIANITNPAVTQANSNITAGGGTGGLGFTSGTLVAELQVVSGTGNIHNVSADGNDDTTFEVVSALPNVIKASDGSDLLNNAAALTITSSTYKIESSGGTPFDLGPLTNWPFSPNTADRTLNNFYATEDGGAQFATTPEPATVVVWGLLGLCVVGGLRLRRRAPFRPQLDKRTARGLIGASCLRAPAEDAVRHACRHNVIARGRFPSCWDAGAEPSRPVLPAYQLRKNEVPDRFFRFRRRNRVPQGLVPLLVTPHPQAGHDPVPPEKQRRNRHEPAPQHTAQPARTIQVPAATEAQGRAKEKRTAPR